MSRIIELNDSPLRAVINDQGKIAQIIDERGNDMGIPTTVVDPVTGRIEQFIGIRNTPQWDQGQVVAAYSQKAPSWLSRSIFSDRSKILPTSSAQMTTVASPGAAVGTAVSTSVKFRGNPSWKLAVAAGSTGKYVECGFAGATYTIPAQVQRAVTTGYVVAVKPPAGATLDNTTNGACEIYLGDATYANFAKFIAKLTNVPAVTDSDGWVYLHCDPQDTGAKAVTGTEVNYASALRAKIRFYTLNNGGPSGDWYIGGIWACPPAAKPVVIFTLDDGFEEWHSFIRPEAKKRGIPVSMSVGSGLIDTAGYMTSAQVKEIIDDPSGLFSVHNHSRLNASYATLGLTEYLAGLDHCDSLLSSLGCPEIWRKIHPYVQGSYDQALIDAMKVRGFLSMRVVGVQTGNTLKAVSAALKTNDIFTIPSSSSLDNANTVATVIGYIESAKARNSPVHFIKGHEFKAAQGELAWIAGYHDSYGVLNLMDYLADERDAGNITLATWGDWVESIYYGHRML